ncbi:ImmA/IrrE family metallo-endopeptidase, partial [Megamonas sp.]
MMTSNLYPQYKKMQTLAREQLLTLPVGLPIKVKPIVNYILNNENFEIYTYKDYAKLEGFELTFDNIEKYFNSKDAKLVYNSNDDMYTLFYNSEMPSIRKAWTFAHKLGHYFAGHHFYIENDNVSKELNNVLEQEANCFARELLVPSGLVLYIADYYKSRDVISFYTILRAIFNLSKEASFY